MLGLGVVMLVFAFFCFVFSAYANKDGYLMPSYVSAVAGAVFSLAGCVILFVTL